MLKNKEFFTLISHNNLEFRTEDPIELQFELSCDIKELEQRIINFHKEFDDSFSITIDDQIINIPDENLILKTIIKAIPTTNVKCTYKFKKSQLILPTKNVNTVIYFDYKNLVTHLDNLDFEEFQEFIFCGNSFCNIIICKWDTPFLLKNDYVKFFNIHETPGNFSSDGEAEEKKNMILQKNNQLSSFNSAIPKIIPEQLFFLSPTTSQIHEIFNKWCVFLCINSLSSYTEKSSNGESYLCHFNGQKKIILETTYDLSKEHSIENLFDFYEWIFSEKTEDKLKIFQNLLPLHINLESTINLDKFLDTFTDLVNSTKENFNFYIQDNIKVYLDERKKIEDIIMSTGNLISIEINRITDLLIRTLTGVFLSIISAIIAVFIRADIHNAVGYGLYMFSLIILISLLYLAYFACSSVNISYTSFNDRVSEYSYLFNEDRMYKIKSSIIKRRWLFFKVLIITSIILLMFIIVILALGMYFQNGENTIIECLIRTADKFTKI